MKKFFLLSLLLLSVITLQAQETPNDFSDRIKSIFQHVDKTPVTTGILLDVGIDFSNLNNFDGSILADSNLVSLKEWRGIYGSLLTSQFSNSVSFTSFPSFNTSLNALVNDELATPFVYLHYNYQELRTDAISAGLMYESGDQLYDVLNRTQSPYLTKTAFAIAPQKEYFTAPGGYVNFTIPSSLMFGNTGKTISTLKIDLGDGIGLQTRSVNSPFSATYTTTGYKTITYQVSFTDNSTLISHSRIYVEVSPVEETPGGGSISSAYHARTGHTITINTPDGVKKAFLQIMLSNNHTNDDIIKPLIVVEGIDFWKITTPNNPSEDFTVGRFLNQTLRRPLLPGNNFLNNEIDLLGYDIIFVNFDEATDALETNSQLVQAAIQWVNGNKTGTTDNVVLGLSMGGVIARHALRTLEINNIDHHTSLYISMDSPHQGANFPLALQAFVKHLNNAEFSLLWGAFPIVKLIDQYPELKVAKQLLDVPASKQLLYYRIGDGGSLPIDNTQHDNFYATYHALGMPSTRNIAISNGSQCGVLQPFPPYTLMFEVDSVMPLKLPVIANIIDFFTAPYQVVGGLFTNRPFIGFGSILGVFSTKNTFVTSFSARSLPNQTNQQIYKGFVGVKRKILGLFNVNSFITNRSVNASSYMLPLDNGVGGQASFSDGSSVGVPSGLSDVVKIPGFNYVPSVSSLDIGNGNTIITPSQLYTGYNRDSPTASPNNSPFDNFVTSVTGNDDHVTFTPRNGDFLIKELSGVTTGFANCGIFCNPTSSFLITGPIVSGANSTYSISSLPAGTTIDWQVNGGYAIVGPSNTTTVGVATPTNNSQYAELVATLRSTCGQFNVKKTLVPAVITANLYGNGACGEGIAEINVPSGANFIWRVDGDLSINGQGKTLSTTSNSIGLTGLSGLITCEFKSYNNTIVTQFVYQPYQKPISIAVNPMYGSEPLSATITGIDFGYNIIRWYLDESLTNETSESYYDGNLSCGMHTLRAEIDLACGSTVSLGPLEVERYCSFLRNMVIYPNPAVSSNLFIAPDEGKMEKASPREKSKIKEYDYWLYDARSNVILKGRSKNFKVELDTRNLKSDTYFLHLRTEGDKEIIKKQVIIRN